MRKIIVNLGDRFYHKLHGWYEVIEILPNLHVKVKFANTDNVVVCSKYHCFDSKVSDKKSDYYHQVGEIYENDYGKYEIIQTLKYKKAIVRFLDTGTEVESTIRNIVIGKIKDHNKPVIFGVGYLGLRRNPREKFTKNKAYNVWHNMIMRCYSKKNQKFRPTYSDCYVCDEWHNFSVFEQWYNENCIDDFYLDKDILFKGNKEYAPDKCCFVPNEINVLFTKRQNYRGDLPIGVQYSGSRNGYKAGFTKGTEKFYLGCYDTAEEAFAAYKQAKEAWIKEMANKWKDKLKPNVYEALMNYQVEITD